ncbi:MAG: hypothetical protein DME65_02865 [Verrucomicrobia bacterium]|nr:MAG: hypothetical protein DME65_02865 [Verrucomicrobiota bacterium]
MDRDGRTIWIVDAHREERSWHAPTSSMSADAQHGDASISLERLWNRHKSSIIERWQFSTSFAGRRQNE